jgi:hypothetical protein
VQGRLSGKQYPDTSTVTYAYETTTRRLKSITDALGQVKTFGYPHSHACPSFLFALRRHGRDLNQSRSHKCSFTHPSAANFFVIRWWQ